VTKFNTEEIPQGNGKKFAMLDAVRINEAFMADGDKESDNRSVDQMMEELYGMTEFQSYAETGIDAIPDVVATGTMGPREAIGMLVTGAFQVGYIMACERLVEGFEVEEPDSEAFQEAKKRIEEYVEGGGKRG
jgi:hypothetical protein